MPRIDMSAEAVTAQLKLGSKLRRFCLSARTAKLKPKIPVAAAEDEQNIQLESKSPSRASK